LYHDGARRALFAPLARCWLLSQNHIIEKPAMTTPPWSPVRAVIATTMNWTSHNSPAMARTVSLSGHHDDSRALRAVFVVLAPPVN
jgi:hypothetical protein